MSPNLVSQEELLAVGWKKRQIEAALDEPDEVGPSGHWLNTSGKPYYDRDRAAVAAYRIGLQKELPTDAQWRKWARSTRPTSLPVLTADFHRIADAWLPGVSNRFWSLRLSHPVLGRRPRTREEEALLIDDCLIQMVKAAFGIELENEEELEKFLTEKSTTAAQSLGVGWSEGIVVRPAGRTSYVSKATSKKAVERFICALSLLHVGAVKGVLGQLVNMRKVLVDSPRMRFDSMTLSKVSTNT
jgi:hypothetical protein